MVIAATHPTMRTPTIKLTVCSSAVDVDIRRTRYVLTGWPNSHALYKCPRTLLLLPLWKVSSLFHLQQVFLVGSGFAVDIEPILDI